MTDRPDPLQYLAEIAAAIPPCPEAEHLAGVVASIFDEQGITVTAHTLAAFVVALKLAPDLTQRGALNAVAGVGTLTQRLIDGEITP